MTRQKYVVRVVRPVFQATYLEVEGRDENEACSVAFSSAYHIPDEKWTGHYNPDDFLFDVHCVRASETADGHPFSLLDFPQYNILTTNENGPYVKPDGIQCWMNDLHPLTVAGQLSQWIRHLEEARSGYYEEAIEDLEEMLRNWKGTNDKIVPLIPPERLRYDIEYVEALLDLVRIMNEVD